MSKTMMRDRVAIGQRWQRRRDRQAGRIRQIHRADRQVELELDGVIALVTFADLRTRWRQFRRPAITRRSGARQLMRSNS